MNFLKKRFLGLGVSGFARLFFFHIAACDGIAGSELVEKLEAAVENGRLPGAVVLVAQKDRVLALEAVMRVWLLLVIRCGRGGRVATLCALHLCTTCERSVWVRGPLSCAFSSTGGVSGCVVSACG